MGMNADVASALIAAVFIVAVLTVLATRDKEARTERKRVKADYVDPLRRFAEEVHYRIEDMFRFPGNRKSLVLAGPADVFGQPDEWFNGEGCYFASTCYLTACLFAAMMRVREGSPYLRLNRSEDTELVSRLLRVSHEFLDDLGIYYLVQHSIGEQMWDSKARRPLTYREFCEALRDPERRVWFDRLLQFYIDVGNGARLDQLRRAQQALEALSTLLDGGAAIAARKQAERLRWRSGTEPPELPRGDATRPH
jgi:hypothetical protein